MQPIVFQSDFISPMRLITLNLPLVVLMALIIGKAIKRKTRIGWGDGVVLIGCLAGIGMLVITSFQTDAYARRMIDSIPNHPIIYKSY